MSLGEKGEEFSEKKTKSDMGIRKCSQKCDVAHPKLLLVHFLCNLSFGPLDLRL